MSLRSISTVTKTLAGPSRLRSNGQIIRKYATQSNGSQQNQTIGEMLNRRAFAAAWRALSPNQKMIFGGLVGLGAFIEYSLLDKFVLGPVKLKKEEEKRAQMERNLGINNNMDASGNGTITNGGNGQEVFLEINSDKFSTNIGVFFPLL
ncbi:uncharacterized protein L201_004211 [Kwoniella dendrophila CBS 6074]|uniref:Uncharacterized protein n=1 Tax=Kwoniella dendrophila CBS 6074 TaxID=1295534 RepID=A0AAX4JV17_9TREE